MVGGGLIWERSRHRSNSTEQAIKRLENGLRNGSQDKSGNILVRWRPLYPLSKEMAEEYARSISFEYVDAILPQGSSIRYLMFREAACGAADGEEFL